jgi:hypothetical protein
MTKVCAIILLAFASPCFAQWDQILEIVKDDAIAGFYNGNQLFDLEKTNRAAFVAYVVGVHDATKVQLRFCTPERATGGQLADVVKKYFQDNPAVRDQQAHRLITNALETTWRCQTKSP